MMLTGGAGSRGATAGLVLSGSVGSSLLFS